MVRDRNESSQNKGLERDQKVDSAEEGDIVLINGVKKLVFMDHLYCIANNPASIA